VEVDEEARGDTAQAQVGDELGFVDREKSLDGLDFEDELVLDHEIEPVRAFEQEALVTDGQTFLPFEPQPPQPHLARKALPIRGLQEPRPHHAVHFDTSPNHKLRTIPKPSRLLAFLLHSTLSATPTGSCSQDLECPGA
jgi:hypothetical protein